MFEKICVMCGKKFIALRDFRKYCSECQIIKKRQTAREWAKNKTKIERKEKVLEISLNNGKNIYIFAPNGIKGKRVKRVKELTRLIKGGER